MDDFSPPTIKLNDTKRHASLSSSFLLENSLHLGIIEMTRSQKLVGSSDTMMIDELGYTTAKTLDYSFKSY